MNILDLFSGIGGFSKGLLEAGLPIEHHYFSEIDPHAIANYSYNFKHSTYVGSVTDVSRWDIPRPSIITFGSPCQDFSLAGKRKGLDGDRSSLIAHAIMAIELFRPDAFIWENVKGAFSSNAGADFWAILQAFANIGGYRLEWQLLNTAWLLPQNRERICLVGHLAGRSRPGVFPIREVDGQNTRVPGQRAVANTILARYGPGIDANGSYVVERKQPAQRTSIINMNRQESQVAGTLEATYYKGPEMNFGTRPFVKICDQDDIRVRRLTEIECERLQGFPDDWTSYGLYDGVVKEIVRTQRYRMCGNAVTVDVVKAIGLKLKQNLCHISPH